MEIWHEDIDRVRYYCIDKSYRNAKGNPTHFKRRTTDPVIHAKHVMEASQLTAETSLTSSRFSECVSIYLDESGTGGFSQKCYTYASAELGRLYPDRPNFAVSYAQYCAKLESKYSVNTVNNYKTVVRSVCNYNYKTGRIKQPTVRDYNLKQGNQRERILSDTEILSIENKLREWDSHLLQPILFALKNPIRKSDLFNLKRSDLKMEIVDGERVWVVQFLAKKTRRTAKGIITTLPNIDTDFLNYTASLPGDCQWLFPMIGTAKNGEHTKLKPNTWRKIQDADRHWNSLLAACNIPDFHFHDLKHCAETYMLRQGYNYDEMRKLGIQMSPKTQKIYDNRSQLEIVAKKLSSQNVASEKNNDSGSSMFSGVS